MDNGLGFLTDYTNELAKRAKELSGTELRVGVFADDGSELAMIAAVNEYGARIPVTKKLRGYFGAVFGVHLRKDTEFITIPERSFLRAGLAKAMSDQGVTQKVQQLLSACFDPDKMMDVQQAYDLIGALITGEMHEYLVELSSPPNSQLTTDRKHSSNPLIDTGRLNQSITHKII
jgi:hypothetical protein